MQPKGIGSVSTSAGPSAGPKCLTEHYQERSTYY